MNPDLPGIWSYLGEAKSNDGDAVAAQRAFEEALRRDPNDFDANLHLGGYRRIDKEFEEAEEFLNRALRLRPNSIPARYQLATLMLETGKTEEAVADLEKVVEESPKYLEAHVSLARGYYRLRRKEDGDRIRQRIRELEAEEQQKELEDN
jgi:cytochrome c-type biogenesis protein CcmH/NrfG